MPAPPSAAPFADVLADLTIDFKRGASCLVVCDKGWTLPLYVGLKERLNAIGLKCGYLDGKVKEVAGADGTVIPASVAQMRWAVRAPEAEGIVFAVPHLDIVTTTEGGWTPVSREVIALLYENPLSIWLGFQDPSLKLPELVTKVFTRRYVIETPYRTLETVRPQPAPKDEPQPEAPAPQPEEQTTAAPVPAPEVPVPDAPEPKVAVRFSWEPPDEPPAPPADGTTSSPADPG